MYTTHYSRFVGVACLVCRRYHDAVFAAGAVPMLAVVALNNDVQMQRHAARCLSNLSLSPQLRNPIAHANPRGAVHPVTGHRVRVLTTLYHLGRSVDVLCQRFASLALANICSEPSVKNYSVEGGAVRPLLFMVRFPDLEIQR